VPGKATRLSHGARVMLLAGGAGLPGSLIALALLWFGDYSSKVQWTLTLLVVSGWAAFAFALQEAVIRPLQTLSNLLAALREEDFSFRARTSRREDDALTQAMREVNLLADTLREQRLGALEATALLRKVMEEIDVVVFAFDGRGKLRLANRAGERLLGLPLERLLGEDAGALGLAEALREGAPRVLDLTFPAGQGRWEVRHGTVRQGGLPLQLLVLADVSRALRDEERQAWQRLIRVLGHELNNSLAPIKSVAGSLESLLGRPKRPSDWEDDLRRGLAVIAARAEALSRFMEAYSRLARLPPPQLQETAVAPLVQRAARLETRVPVAVDAGPDLRVHADPDQLEQLLINLLRNAAEASLETGGDVHVGWAVADGHLDVWVDDEGPGLPQTANLFVPFFTTKAHGSGIGLVLSRQIAEAHGGTLTLQNRAAERGCRARLRLPV
jgi:nitrogen fixation/metabolism regulation signal transduction histidine kinase